MLLMMTTAYSVMEKNGGVVAVCCVCWAWSSVNPVMMIQLWRKHFPDIEEDDCNIFLMKTSAHPKF
jgi:hypothetical protein